LKSLIYDLAQYKGQTWELIFKNVHQWAVDERGLALYADHWFEYDPPPVEPIPVHPDDGFYLSLDGGNQWQQQYKGLFPPMYQSEPYRAVMRAGMFGLTFDADEITTVYAATNFGIFRSTDSGQTWAKFDAGLPTHESDVYNAVSTILYSRGLLYALIQLWPTIYDSHDVLVYKGTYDPEWQQGYLSLFGQPYNPFETYEILQLTADLNQPQRLYLTGNQGLLTSDNNGVSWHTLTPELVYWVSGSLDNALYLSTPHGVITMSLPLTTSPKPHIYTNTAIGFALEYPARYPPHPLLPSGLATGIYADERENRILLLGQSSTDSLDLSLYPFTGTVESFIEQVRQNGGKPGSAFEHPLPPTATKVLTVAGQMAYWFEETHELYWVHRDYAFIFRANNVQGWPEFEQVLDSFHWLPPRPNPVVTWQINPPTEAKLGQTLILTVTGLPLQQPACLDFRQEGMNFAISSPPFMPITATTIMTMFLNYELPPLTYTMNLAPCGQFNPLTAETVVFEPFISQNYRFRNK
jgi:hypothetical protein